MPPSPRRARIEYGPTERGSSSSRGSVGMGHTILAGGAPASAVTAAAVSRPRARLRGERPWGEAPSTLREWSGDDRHRPRRRPRTTSSASTPLLDDEERLLRDTVRQFVGDRILPDVGRLVRGGTFPEEMAKEMGALGLLGMHLDGLRLRRHQRRRLRPGLPRARGRRQRRSAASCPCRARWPCSRSGRTAREEQKQEWLPRMAAGEAIGCFGLTEPDSGSRPVVACAPGPAATATTGCSTAPRCGSPTAASPTWPSCGPVTDDGLVRGFVVPTDTPGFTANDIHQKMSLRASITSELVLDDVRLPAERRAARRGLHAGPAVVPERGPLRHPLRRRRARPGPATRPPCDYAIEPRAVRQAHRRLPARPSASWSR